MTSPVKATLGILLSLGTIWGCRPQPEADSGAKSLDELSSSSSDLPAAACQGEYSADSLDPGTVRLMARQISRGPADSEAVARVMSAVPHGLKRVFFQFGYELHFVADIATVCRNVSGYAPGAPTCSRSERVGDAGEKVRLYVGAVEEDMAHGTLISMMSVIDERLGRITFSASGQPLLGDQDQPGFVAFKKDLTLAVLDDGIRSGQDFAMIRDLLPADPGFFEPGTSTSDRERILAGFLAAKPALARALHNEIFDNAGDSFYCNGETRESMKTHFPGAFTLWQDAIHPDLHGQALEGTSTGIALWGRWGRGNGPLRQVFRNRVQQTGTAFPRAQGFRRPWDGSGTWVRPPAWGSGQRLGWRWR